MRKTTVVTSLLPFLPAGLGLEVALVRGVFLSTHQQDKDAKDVITMEEDAALHKTPAEKAKETVMEHLKEDRMMETEDALVIWCVGAITAGSLVSTTMRRMIAVNSLPLVEEEEYQ